jgi:hypothetical protein
MRKEDRVRQQQNQNRSPEQPEPKPQSEQVKGSTSGDQPSRPPREPGKLPLPD